MQGGLIELRCEGKGQSLSSESSTTSQKNPGPSRLRLHTSHCHLCPQHEKPTGQHQYKADTQVLLLEATPSQRKPDPVPNSDHTLPRDAASGANHPGLWIRLSVPGTYSSMHTIGHVCTSKKCIFPSYVLACVVAY